MRRSPDGLIRRQGQAGQKSGRVSSGGVQNLAACEIGGTGRQGLRFTRLRRARERGGVRPGVPGDSPAGIEGVMGRNGAELSPSSR